MVRRSQIRSLANIAITMSLLVSLCVPFTTSAQKPITSDTKPMQSVESLRLEDTYDIRRSVTGTRHSPTPAQLAVVQRLQAQIKGLEVRFDPFTGVPRHVFSLAERLTAPRQADALTIARDYLRAHRTLWRLTERDISQLVVAKNFRTRHNGVRHVVFKQFYHGLDVFQGDIKVNIDRHGQILSVNANYFPDIVASMTPRLSATEAVQRAADYMAPHLAFTPRITAVATSVEQATTFEQGPFTSEPTAKLTIFPAADRARLAWKVRLHLMDELAWYDILVDAETGEILFHHNLIKFSEPDGLVFDVHPDRGPQVLRSFAGDPIASPNSWVSPWPNTGTQGNNALTLPLAFNAEQRFHFPFANVYATEGLNAFDLDRTTLRFTPNAAGGYDVRIEPLRFDANLGTDITSRLRPDRDDGSVSQALGFSFPFFGTVRNTVFINANGNITWTGANSDATESFADMIMASPRIAALWDDLDLSALPQGSGLFVRRDADRLVITWNRVPQFGAADANTFQITLLADGVIELSYNGIRATDALVGVSRGANDFNLRAVDFSAITSLTGWRDGLAEKFPSIELDAVATNVFYHFNLYHDYLYKLGFDEAAGNFQADNFGRGGVGNDPIMIWPQHTGVNNAFFGTAEDGRPGFSGFYLFTSPPFRQADSALDADVIYHEATHGLTTRMVGNAYDASSLSSFQSGAMGEGWSDAYANTLTNDPVTGEYSTGRDHIGIRSVNYAANSLTYGDFGNRRGPLTRLTLAGQPITGGLALERTFIAQVHQDGEIWATVMWDLREALGKEVAEQLMTDGLKFTPSNPSMLDARDAILIADVANGARHQAAIWSVFAARGMGVSARADNGDDTVVFHAFDTPWARLPAGREIIFSDTVSSSASEWTVTGDSGNGAPALWHISFRRGTAWYYGRQDTRTYNTGQRNFGALTSPVIHLPTIPPNSAIVLTFDHFLRAQDVFSTVRDNGYVRVIETATGQVWQVAFINNNTIGALGSESFQREEINLSAFAGKTIQIQFYFDTIDANTNDAEGWFIDNIIVSRRTR
ncbi:MAG: M36 family metallopeptidase [Acidobacteriota bacterium]|nr:M36 family metallopeptidase [Blastocatellia bacterium]MDW8238102.1 M36 family metallopeptidase [Acidobacteriota bacterium]